MTKYRKLHTQIIESDDFNSMPSDFTRLTWTLLMLVLDREGRALDNLSNLRAKIYPLRDDVTINMIKLAFDWFADHNMITRYEVEGKRYFYQTQFAKYQGDTSREGYSIYPPPPGYQPPEPQAEDDQEEEVAEQEIEETESRPTPELVKTYARPTQDLVESNSRSSSASTLNTTLDSASSSSSPPILPPVRDKPSFTHERPPRKLPKLPIGEPDDHQLSNPEIYDLIERTFGIWKEICHQPEDQDKEKISQWGRLFGRQRILATFTAAKGRYRTLAEIYNSIDSNGNGEAA